MKKIFCILLIFAGINLLAGETQTKIVLESAQILRNIMQIPEKSIPIKLLRNAKALAIIPHVVKVSFVVGGRFGKGILIVKQKNGYWSSPCFINLTGGSIGWQIGAQATDIILVFKTIRGVEGIVSGKFTLGANVAVAAGPVGRNASVSTDAMLNAEIYSYSRSKGLFAGACINGSAISINNGYNELYYHKKVFPTDIFSGYDIIEPQSAKILDGTISRYTN